MTVVCVGSNPLRRTIYARLAQLVEHLTLNQVARGSSPRSRTIMVDVVQLVERQIVVLVVVGSSPIVNHIYMVH